MSGKECFQSVGQRLFGLHAIVDSTAYCRRYGCCMAADRAMHNIITGNTIVGKVANNAHIHLNGELNYAVDNTVRVNDTVPGGICVSSSLSMYGSYVLSNPKAMNYRVLHVDDRLMGQ